ncbi:hypothetical protein MN116_007912 [Schistosoma mekongi]|uniref:Enoyl reductase (ER) domain-containing protein n=1 Tax=Schistosoma mekongi TaxID=38744 RepID=A0AAE1Z6Y9_SCHME|nr:hypothetical protein MN116_007912 [Schistosoma mekongi]
MKLKLPKTISAWQMMNFLRPGVVDIRSELHLTKTRRMPSITRPDQLLIKVKAVSLNPVDSLLIYGYGSSSFNLLRRFASNCEYLGIPDIATAENADFPFTPGRDFSGQIIDIGPEVASSSNSSSKKLIIGTNVAGATWPFLSTTGSGSLAEYIICPASYVASVPSNVPFITAAALGYAGLTAWSALVDSGGVKPVNKSTSPPSILITGATGGVGFIAAQLAKLWGWKVHVTCPGDEKAFDLMNSLQVDQVFPYPTKIPTTEKYDLILDCVRPDYLNVKTPSSSSTSNTYLEQSPLFNNLLPQLPSMLTYLNTSSSYARYLVLNPTLLYLTDYWGPFLGIGIGFSQLLSTNIAATFSLNTFTRNVNPIRWVFFKPNSKALQYMLNLISNKQLTIPIDTVYKFSDVPDAFNRLYSKGKRGKLVIEVG